MASELRRVGWLPALAIVASGVIGAFVSLLALGADSRAQPRQIRAAVGHATAQPPVPTSTPHPQVVEPPAGGSTAKNPPSPAHHPATSTPRPQPARRVGSSLHKAAGRKIMTGFSGATPSPALLSRIRRGEVGGVILFAANITTNLSRTVSGLQQAARAGANAPLLIATDQEGGAVRRISTAPPFTAPAQMTAASAAGEGAASGRALASRGINTDLAPVADVNHGSSFLGSRSFGSDPGQVSAAACRFAAGLQSAGVNATLKHFPGLGRTAQNTDLRPVTVGAGAQALLADLAPYRRCAAQTKMVMLSNATYPALDPGSPAVFSKAIIRDLLRDRYGFGGVTISDTLGAPGVASPSTAVRASRAGVDMLLYTDEAVSALAYQKLLAAVRDRQLTRSSVFASARRIRALTG